MILQVWNNLDYAELVHEFLSSKFEHFLELFIRKAIANDPYSLPLINMNFPFLYKTKILCLNIKQGTDCFDLET